VLEITYRCNMNCRICFADANRETFEPTLPEVKRMFETALAANRFCSVQLSGGEPTVRDDLPEIIRMGKAMKIMHLQVNTNGLRLAADPDYARALKDAGTDLIYLQFDGLRDDVYETIRGRPMLDVKLRAIEACEKAGLGVLLVPVVVPGVNLDNLGEIVRFAKAHIPTIRGVHFQPVSYFGRFPGRTPPDESRCSLSDVLHALVEQSDGELQLRHFVPRKQYEPHCDFSSTYFLDESGSLRAISDRRQNAADTAETDFVEKTNRYTEKRWRYQPGTNVPPKNELERFALRTVTHSFCLSGMGFQDVWNVDLERLKGCCVHVVTPDGRLVPLCAFHLTGASGERLYRNRRPEEEMPHDSL